MSALLSVRDLKAGYPLPGGLVSAAIGNPSWVEVVSGVSFEIEQGETLAIVGESGSGKTTLAMALAGLAPMLEGEVRFDGQRLARDAGLMLQPERRRMALMFQDPVGSLSPRMTVGDILAEPQSIHGVSTRRPQEEAHRLLSLVGLGAEFSKRYPHQLSGGQARRVGVARALALEPELLIADEPTAGLDVSIQGEVLNLLSRLQAEMGLAILIITHNLNIVRHVADNMAIMYLGRFVEQGDSAQVLDHPCHPYTGALLSANPSPDPDAVAKRIQLVGEVPSLLRRPQGCEFHTRCPRARERCQAVFPELRKRAETHTFNCFYPIADGE